MVCARVERVRQRAFHSSSTRTIKCIILALAAFAPLLTASPPPPSQLQRYNPDGGGRACFLYTLYARAKKRAPMGKSLSVPPPVFRAYISAASCYRGGAPLMRTGARASADVAPWRRRHSLSLVAAEIRSPGN